ncbi:uncharacterized protein PFL1_02591 [Pseudozyma flocculosa PF-1]|uniref:Transcription regulator Rua1 C-terminal domain-containing protein n=1 Tax=Pseudozyma flocculosa PF-1 TaxID=1277687 RepID=A0A061HBG8_9BASI|nr:uncharacterized protein PFL1_02591 [Pseudozyma flocculosa PF-1]EPQ29918.1 hypothetical protein PFL1_02591 [Pseudozyma flocculosa PF-1]
MPRIGSGPARWCPLPSASSGEPTCERSHQVSPSRVSAIVPGPSFAALPSQQSVGPSWAPPSAEPYPLAAWPIHSEPRFGSRNNHHTDNNGGAFSLLDCHHDLPHLPSSSVRPWTNYVADSESAATFGALCPPSLTPATSLASASRPANMPRAFASDLRAIDRPLPAEEATQLLEVDVADSDLWQSLGADHQYLFGQGLINPRHIQRDAERSTDPLAAPSEAEWPSSPYDSMPSLRLWQDATFFKAQHLAHQAGPDTYHAASESIGLSVEPGAQHDSLGSSSATRQALIWPREAERSSEPPHSRPTTFERLLDRSSSAGNNFAGSEQVSHSQSRFQVPSVKDEHIDELGQKSEGAIMRPRTTSPRPRGIVGSIEDRSPEALKGCGQSSAVPGAGASSEKSSRKRKAKKGRKGGVKRKNIAQSSRHGEGSFNTAPGEMSSRAVRDHTSSPQRRVYMTRLRRSQVLQPEATSESEMESAAAILAGLSHTASSRKRPRAVPQTCSAQRAVGGASHQHAASPAPDGIGSSTLQYELSPGGSPGTAERTEMESLSRTEDVGTSERHSATLLSQTTIIPSSGTDANAIRRFPPGFPIREGFFRFYQRYKISSSLPDDCREEVLLDAHDQQDLQEALRRSQERLGTYNEPRSLMDLYTPRFCRGVGMTKEGTARAADMLQSPSHFSFEEGTVKFLKTKISAYNYHLQYTHGISAVTGLPFTPPVAFKTCARPKAAVSEKTEILRGKCHVCKKYVEVEGVKLGSVKVPEIYWWWVP